MKYEKIGFGSNVTPITVDFKNRRIHIHKNKPSIGDYIMDYFSNSFFHISLPKSRGGRCGARRQMLHMCYAVNH